jgi:hypothetical protein
MSSISRWSDNSTPPRAATTEQLYVATNLEHWLLPADYPAAIWITQRPKSGSPQRRLYYRFTPEVWAWIWQQLGKANAKYWGALDRGEPCVDLEEKLQTAATRLKPLYAWANTHGYETGICKPRLSAAPTSQEILERMDDYDSGSAPRDSYPTSPAGQKWHRV